jgi:putative transposase
MVFIHFYCVLCRLTPVMRFPRVKAEGRGFYHCISRFVHGLFIFGTSGERCSEAEDFLSRMRRQAAFTGFRILDYVLMGNHFHLLCDVPEPQPLTQSELLERIEAFYGPQRVQALREQLACYAQQPDGIEQTKGLLEPYRKRMYDISIFAKELNGGFAQGYNRRHKRYGAVWAERFKSVLLEGGRAVEAIAAYIELNPVRAGLCEDPKDYRYCGYAEAIGKGAALALEGIRTILNLPPTASREELEREYRKLLYLKGAAASENNPPAFDLAEAQKVVEQEKGELSPEQRLRCKIRSFSEGVILGSHSFVESHYQRLKKKFGYKRKRGPTPLKILGPAALWVFRKLRVRAFG